MLATKTPATLDLLHWERQLWEGDYSRIAGIDEVGRGALAGPLLAAAVVLPPTLRTVDDLGPILSLIRDSKTLTARKRELIAEAILTSEAQVGIGVVEPDEIDAIGINPANRAAMERAFFALDPEPDILLIDAITLDLDTPQIGIIDGDAQSLSIAAASIVAKVARDRLMMAMHTSWPVYGFDRNKGYGVALHLTALQRYGPCRTHRRSFAPVRRSEAEHDQH